METALTILGHVLFWLAGVTGVVIIFLGLPGTFLILGVSLLFAWLTGFATIQWSFLGLLLGIALLAELVEFGLGAAAARKFGSSKAGLFGTIIGAFVVGILATPIVPPIGMILGALVGAFLGAVLFEFVATGDWHRSLRAGSGAFWGTLGGRAFKILAAVIMLLLLAMRIY
jgi:uncharacterized protein YqgC (DUF456 family)